RHGDHAAEARVPLCEAHRRAAAKRVADRLKAQAIAKAKKDREIAAKAAAKKKIQEAKAKAQAAIKAKREREVKARTAAREAEVRRKAKEKAMAEAKKLRDQEAKRKAIETERLRKQREIERLNKVEADRVARREAEELKRLEALDRKKNSKPYAGDSAFLEEVRQLLVAERQVTAAQVADSDAKAEEMLVDRERLEYDDEDGSSVASDIERDQAKEYASQLRLKIDEIDVALSRIADSSYGRCDECYESIGRDRLRFQVPVFLCLKCRANV
ncbi:MAG: hypothetical protein WCL17_04345, partial [Actinomycetota bacterium]